MNRLRWPWIFPACSAVVAVGVFVVSDSIAVRMVMGCAFVLCVVGGVLVARGK